MSEQVTQQDVHRVALEDGAISALAHAVMVNRDKAEEIGNAMRTAIDALLGVNVQKCTCGPGEACSSCPTRPVLTEGDAKADLAGTRRPDNHID